MRKLINLTKDELLSLLYNNYDLSDDILCECASCGITENANIYFICDKCNEELLE